MRGETVVRGRADVGRPPVSARKGGSVETEVHSAATVKASVERRLCCGCAPSNLGRGGVAVVQAGAGELLPSARGRSLRRSPE
ncbi:hypothetical protein E1301_Tti013398 [Triplophysa tibetana]|uniref:Uncharacterized protein n=1 Tax=Triplophysa tibetana TaxID=1572043 RepID=A0A5A9NVL7_9TELE|nr:hypothetical protein E1301_Tti013398 [Triplophysa tibetana]